MKNTNSGNNGNISVRDKDDFYSVDVNNDIMVKMYKKEHSEK